MNEIISENISENKSENRPATLLRTLIQLIETKHLYDIAQFEDLISDINELPQVVGQLLNNVRSVLEDIYLQFDSISGQIPQKKDITTETKEQLKKLDDIEKKLRAQYSGLNLTLSTHPRDILDILEGLRRLVNDLGDVLKSEYDALDKVILMLEKEKMDGKLSVSKKEDPYYDEIAGIEEFGKNSEERVNNIIQELWRVRGRIEKLRNSLPRMPLGKIGPESEIEDAIYIGTSLLLKCHQGLRGINVLDILTGLKSVTANPTLEEILLYLPKEDPNTGEVKRYPEPVSLPELFYRYPPFEPIPIPDPTWNNEVRGNLIWFVKSKNIRFGSRAFTDPKLSKKLIIDGEVNTNFEPIKLMSVSPIDLFGDSINKYLILTIETKYGSKSKKIWIKYGSAHLKEDLQRGIPIRKVEEKYRLEMKSRGRKAYLPTNLSYVWYCTWGLGMSNDPWDVTCPFQKYCPYGKYYSKGPCPKWSWSRRIHPKVFPYIERYHGDQKVQVTESKIYPSFLKILWGRNVSITELYKGVQLTLPHSNIPTQVEFTQPLGRRLPKTNIIGFIFPRKILETVIEATILNPATSPLVNILGVSVTLTDILMSKYYIVRRTDEGLRTYGLLQRESNEIVRDYKRFRDKIMEEFKTYGAESRHVKEFINWALYTLMHSLAHLFIEYVSSKLEISRDDLLYLVDITDNELKVIIAENSPMGAMDIIRTIQDKYGTIETLIVEFLKDSRELLRHHEEQLHMYSTHVETQFDRIKSMAETNKKYEIMSKLITNIRERYRELLKEGLVLDIHQFSTHLLLSEKEGIEVITDTILGTEPSIDSYYKGNIKEEIQREFDNIISIVFSTYCIDGCPYCVMLGRGCTKGISEGLFVSKELVKYILDVLFFQKGFRGEGAKTLKSLLTSLTKKKIVALSPYIDEEGIKLLNSLVSKGISVTLITTSSMVSRFKPLLDNRISVYVWDQDHDKRYVIDDKLTILTTTNLNLKSNRFNNFQIVLGPDMQLEQILKNAHKVEI